jgi:DNA-binding NarL/FixJ family response regulator
MSTAAKPHRVVIVDDHAGIREGLRALLEIGDEFELCGEADNAAQALEVIASKSPDIAVIDISLKGAVHGLDLTRQIKKLHPATAVLVLSLHAEAEFAAGALAAGASGYLSKSEAGEFLPEALQVIMEGGTFTSIEMQEKIARARQG